MVGVGWSLEKRKIQRESLESFESHSINITRRSCNICVLVLLWKFKNSLNTSVVALQKLKLLLIIIRPTIIIKNYRQQSHAVLTISIIVKENYFSNHTLSITHRVFFLLSSFCMMNTQTIFP